MDMGKMNWNDYNEWKGKVDPKEWLIPTSWFDVCSPSVNPCVGSGLGIEATHPYFRQLLSQYGYNPISTISTMTPPRLPSDWSGFAEKFVDGAAVSCPSWAWSHDPSVAHLMITRADVTMLLFCAKNYKGVTFCDIAKKIGRSEMWTTAALMGEFSVRPEEAEKILDYLGIDKKWQSKIIKVLIEPTIKANHPLTANIGGATDPTIQRLFEILKIYGPSCKAVLNEKLGDGNVSAVDVKVDVLTGGDRSNYGARPRVKFVIDAAFEPFVSY